MSRCNDDDDDDDRHETTQTKRQDATHGVIYSVHHARTERSLCVCTISLPRVYARAPWTPRRVCVVYSPNDNWDWDETQSPVRVWTLSLTTSRSSGAKLLRYSKHTHTIVCVHTLEARSIIRTEWISQIWKAQPAKRRKLTKWVCCEFHELLCCECNGFSFETKKYYLQNIHNAENIHNKSDG